MLGPKGAKVKLKVKKGEKSNPLRIFEAIDRYKSLRDSTISSSVEYTFSETDSSRPSESEGMSVLEEENKEEILAKLKEEENKIQEYQNSEFNEIGSGNKNQENSPVK